MATHCLATRGQIYPGTAWQIECARRLKSLAKKKQTQIAEREITKRSLENKHTAASTTKSILLEGNNNPSEFTKVLVMISSRRMTNVEHREVRRYTCVSVIWSYGQKYAEMLLVSWICLQVVWNECPFCAKVSNVTIVYLELPMEN
jgi:hypothetical protein